jgi:hypothetical protein
MSLLARLSLLLALMAIVAGIDWRRNGSRGTKWREYAFLIVSGLLGGLFGIANDHLTATISADYFVLGKGIVADGQFRLSVTGLGFQAGLCAGAVIGGCYLTANNPKPERPNLAYPRLLQFGLWPLFFAVLVAPLVSLLVCRWDPLDFGSRLGDVLSPPQLIRFLAVWGIHLGLYAGGLIGTICGVVGIRRARAKAHVIPQ